MRAAILGRQEMRTRKTEGLQGDLALAKLTTRRAWSSGLVRAGRIVRGEKVSKLANRLSDNSIKWVAKLEHVREVTLLGHADLAYWRRRLEAEELLLADFDGRVRIMIVAADGRYMFVPHPVHVHRSRR